MPGSQLKADRASLAPGMTVELELVAEQPAVGRFRRHFAAPASVSAFVAAHRWPAAVYALSRIVFLMIEITAAVITRRPLASGFFRFDGAWYLRLAEHGYPSAPLHVPSTLGFLPLYPMVVRAVSAISFCTIPEAAMVVSTAGGLAAAIGVHRLALSWWSEPAARRAVVVFCLFPGAIVFSMAYSECLTIPLAIGCLIALRSRRWLLAGALAGLATAVEPVALVLIIVCLTVAIRHARAEGWRRPAVLRASVAPILSVTGIGAFAFFLWFWTGTPLATYEAQHYGWHEQSQPLALLSLPVVQHVFGHPALVAEHLFAWNLWNGIIGGVFLLFSIRMLIKLRGELSAGALAWTIGIAALTLWSVMTPPNARMSLIAFPAVMIWGRRLSGTRFAVLIGFELAVLAVTAALTFSGQMLP